MSNYQDITVLALEATKKERFACKVGGAVADGGVSITFANYDEPLPPESKGRFSSVPSENCFRRKTRMCMSLSL